MSKDNQKPAPAVDSAKAQAMKPAAEVADVSLDEIARAEAELEAHAAHVERMRVARGISRTALLPAHRGAKTYVVGSSGHYRKGRFFKTGELITITDEKPSREWVLHDPTAAKAVEVQESSPVGRASDQDVA
jgi:hypothetical protein